MIATDHRTSAAACPSRDDLSAFHVGKLPADALDAIAEHLGACPTCAHALDTLDDAGDLLLSELRKPAETRPLDDAEARRAATLVEKIGVELSAPGAASTHFPAVEKSRISRPDLGQLGQYQLLEKLGEGGMGQVFKARHQLMGRTVALKIIHKQHFDQPAAVQRFHREIRAFANLDHPHIVRAHDANQVEDTHFLVMEYVEGTDLGHLVRQRGSLPVAEACAYIRQAADGLQHAHEHGLVHRDIKPSNLMLVGGGGVGGKQGARPTIPQVKILDFGLALFHEDQGLTEGLTAAGQVMGTPDYMAPEQWEDTHQVDIRADIYSLGCTLYHLLAGKPPFSGPEYNTLRKKIKAHAHAPVPPIQGQRPDVPAALAFVLERMLAKEPADRFASPAAVSAALEPFIVPEALHAPEPETIDAMASSGTGSLPAARRSRRPWRFRLGLSLGSLRLRLAFTLGLGLLLAAGAWWKFGREAGTGSPRDLQVADSSKPVKPSPARPLAPPSPSLPAMAGKLRFESMQVSHLAENFAPLGDIGFTSFAARFDDNVRVDAKLSEPAYSYLIAFDPDGKEEVCYPDKEGKAAPPRSGEVHYPLDEKNCFSLTDGVGLQAFVLVVSRQPLPAYQQWRARLGAAPWRKEIHTEVVWRSDDKGLQPFFRVQRGPERGPGAPPRELQELRSFFMSRPGVEAVQVLAFPVKKKDE